MLEKLTFWFLNFLWGMVAIVISTVMHYYGIILRLTDMIVPDNQLFANGYAKGSELCSKLTDKLLGLDQRRGG